MEQVNKQRRRLLQAAALMAGTTAPFAFGSGARALQLVPLEPGSTAGQAYSERCDGDQEHAALVQKLRAALAGDPLTASLSAPCPLCGCSVVARR